MRKISKHFPFTLSLSLSDFVASRLNFIRQVSKTIKRAFTMVELVIVILIVGILALIALPKVTHHDRIVELAEQIANDIRYTQMLAMRNDVDYGSISDGAYREGMLWTIYFFEEDRSVNYNIHSEEAYERFGGLGEMDEFGDYGGYTFGHWRFPLPRHVDARPFSGLSITSIKYGIMRHTYPNTHYHSIHENRHLGSPEERIFARGPNGDLLGCWQKWNSWEAKHLKYDAKTRCNKRFHIRPEDKIIVTFSSRGCFVLPNRQYALPTNTRSFGISFDNMGSPHVPEGMYDGLYNIDTAGSFYARKYRPNQGCDIILRSQKKKAVISVWGETGYVSVKYYDMP